MSARTTPWIVGAIAAALVIVAIFAGARLLNGDRSLLRNATVRYDTITPNADGDRDATPIAYELSRNAAVSIYLENAAGERFYFRQTKPRGAGDYEVLFSGVVDGFPPARRSDRRRDHVAPAAGRSLHLDHRGGG